MSVDLTKLIDGLRRLAREPNAYWLAYHLDDKMRDEIVLALRVLRVLRHDDTFTITRVDEAERILHIPAQGGK